MKADLRKLMDHLGVDHVLASYEADTYQFYDEDKEVTCSAEVRMLADQTEIEVELQVFYDAPEPGQLPVEQIMAMKAKPKNDTLWYPYILIVRGEDMTGGFGEWEEGCCAFYNAVTSYLKRDKMPDIDMLIDEHMDGDKGRAGRAGRRGGGRKNPKFKPPSSTPAMKQGM